MCKYIPAKATYEHLPSAVIKHVISFHAVKGCNTEKTARKVFLENPGLLADVGVGIMTENVLSSVEEFICRLYSRATQTTSVDTVRHVLFSGEEGQKNLPPTSDALSFHVKRSHYHVMIWHDAHYDIPEKPSPVGLGWQQGEEGLQPTLISLEPIPTACLDLIHCSCCNCTKPIAASAENPDCVAPHCMEAIHQDTSHNTGNKGYVSQYHVG